VREKSLSEKRLYRIYSGMKQRCNNPANPSAKYYHFKGIRVCPQWERSFDSFFQWAIGNGYKDNLTIDRVDPRRGYEPSNCRWITREENSRRAHIKYEPPKQKQPVRVIDTEAEQILRDIGLGDIAMQGVMIGTVFAKALHLMKEMPEESVERIVERTLDFMAGAAFAERKAEHC
jgi:hypothetical protein